jgi:adenosylcobinamide-GDP ribazoletransferase
MIKRELRIFLTAVMFYTRIPCPPDLRHSELMLNKATRYFPLIGWIVAGFAFIVYWCFSLFLSHELAIILSMSGSILLTGAFHEDGFADVCDGFGGGYSAEQIMKIMKDSRLGTYGTIGLILILLFKFMLLKSIPPSEFLIVLLLGHSLSRLAPVLTIYSFRYARIDETSKVKPIGKKISTGELIVAAGFGLLPIILTRDLRFLLLLLPILLVQYFMSLYFRKKIGGYTGDCLGAIQQGSEIAVYLVWIVCGKFLIVL